MFCQFLLYSSMILYIENSKIFTRKNLELINESHKVIRYKIKVKKNHLHFYTLAMNSLKIKLGKNSV